MMLQVFFLGYFIGWWSEDERWCTNQNQAHGVLRVKGNRDDGRWHKGKFVSKYDTICVYNCETSYFVGITVYFCATHLPTNIHPQELVIKLCFAYMCYETN